MLDPLHASPDLDCLPVYDAASVPIGETYGVLAEAESGLVRFFDVSLEGRQRHVLVPVGHARVETHLGRLRLRLRAATAAELDRIPSYEPHATWSDDVFQNELLTAFGRLFQGERYYAHPAYDHSGLYAGAHPLLRNPLAPTAEHGLRRLARTSAVRVDDGAPDVRGWPLLGAAHTTLGSITDLIVDPEPAKVRYLVVRRASDDRETVIPIGYTELGENAVVVPLNEEDLAALPELATAVLDRRDEVSLRAVLDSRLAGSRRYARPDFRSAA